MGRRVVVLLLGLLLLAAASLAVAGPEAKGVPAPGPKDRCPVCGMFVAPFPNWMAVAVFEDGEMAYFDGPKDLFRYVFEVSGFAPSHSREQITSLWITEYYSTVLLPAAEAYFITGSDVLGPMGHELVPVQGVGRAKTFLRDHHGKSMVAFEELSPAVLDELP